MDQVINTAWAALGYFLYAIMAVSFWGCVILGLIFLAN